MSIIDLAAGTKLGDVDLGHLTHPEAIAVDPAGTRAYVAVANADRVAVIDLAHAHSRRLALDRPADRRATAPRPSALDADAATATRLLVAESGADELSVFRTANGSLRGPDPDRRLSDGRAGDARTEDAPVDLGKGLGTGSNPNGPNPFETTDANTNSFQYLPIITFGKSGILRVPERQRAAAH